MIKQGKCVSCEGEAVTFRDSKSKKEYAISGFCQLCQDKMFGVVCPKCHRSSMEYLQNKRYYRCPECKLDMAIDGTWLE